MTNSHELNQTKLRLTNWLFDKCLPLWWENGGDLQKGGFFERLNQDLTPNDINRRTRVAARQVYTYAKAELMGYKGETRAPIDCGLNWLYGQCAGNDGYLYAVVAPNGDVVRADFDLYDHAFLLLGLAYAYRVHPEDQTLRQRAEAMLDKIIGDYARKDAGFYDNGAKNLPLKANPHMHLFEACLAWIEAGGGEIWQSLAASLAELGIKKFIDIKTNTILEVFDDAWQPIETEGSRIIEPGHQFEWAWLFTRWYKISNDESFVVAAKKLVEFGEKHGVDEGRGVAFMSLFDNYQPYDFTARLWSQTERIKVHVAMASIANDEITRQKSINNALCATKGLELYFKTKIEGLYFDRMDESGNIIVESAPASSLYHIICAIDEFCAL